MIRALEQDRSACFLRQREHKAVAKVQLCGVARALAKVAVSLAPLLRWLKRKKLFPLFLASARCCIIG
jgi:hypothetical protein